MKNRFHPPSDRSTSGRWSPALGLLVGVALAVSGCSAEAPAATSPTSESPNSGSSASESPTTPSGDASQAYDGAYFKRVNLVVSDLDRALTIYRDVLGFDVDNVSESSEDSYSYPVFRIPRDAQLRFATLSAGTEQVRTLALTEVRGAELPEPPDAGTPFRTASVIRVDDIEATFEKIEDLGLDTTEAKYAGGTDFFFWERAFVDYDGHLIVLYQIAEDPPADEQIADEQIADEQSAQDSSP